MAAGVSIVVSGRPGAGKTTLLSCCLAELDPHCRVVVAEEVFEAEVPVANVAGMQTRGPRPDRPEIDLRRLVAAFLRMAPDVAVVGEVRDREALPLLLTLSSGVTGYTTVHAGSAAQALTRLRFICQLADEATNLGPGVLTALVPRPSTWSSTAPAGRRAEPERGAGGRGCHHRGRRSLHDHADARPGRAGGPLHWTGLVPDRLDARLSAGGRPRPQPRPAGRRLVTGLAWGALAALGVHLLWSRPAPQPRGWTRFPLPPLTRLACPSGRAWLGSSWAPSRSVAPRHSAAGALAAGCAVVGRRSVESARRDQARRLWPGLLEELRVLTTSGGRSLPRALLEAGARVPDPAGDAFRATEKAWRVSADFERSLRVLGDGLAEASTDIVCETLLVAHDLGGRDVGRRLARLAEDRRRDLATRDLAVAKLAGARFAPSVRRHRPVGHGRRRPGRRHRPGRVRHTLRASSSPSPRPRSVAGCWLWAGRLLRLPEAPRVFGR